MNIKKVISCLLGCALIMVASFPVNAASATVEGDEKIALEVNVTSPTGDVVVLNVDDPTVNVSEIGQSLKQAQVAVILEVTPDGDANVVDAVPPETRATVGGSNQNVYWKGTVSVTYNYSSNGFGSLSIVSGNWIQLRGDTFLSNRSVYYAQSGLFSRTATYNHSSNSFYFYTNFPSERIVLLGATSTAYIGRTNSSNRTRIDARVSVEP